MFSILNYTTLFLTLLPLLSLTDAQSSISSSNSTGYTGYNLTLSSDPESVTYDTEDTPANVSTTYPAPDVYLNASVHIGEIDILVANLSAKINLDAQVLNLLTFNAGVDLSIDRVSLTIQNVTAKVLLEARLENLVLMIDDILHSLDLNPVLATLGQDLTNITNTTVGALTGATSSLKRSVPYDLAHNVLFSSNDYSGNTHKNRILEQNGDIVDQYLDNDGNIRAQTTVGTYLKDMTFNGENVTVTLGGKPAQKLEFVYEPFNGLSVVSFVWVGGAGEVLGTQVLSERFAGGESTIGD
ncbi:uncharacterized protein LY89DRAFT_338423 [Mollisia scopiformis]|uniref:Uncharacterized protein n=1 Tax=Mollisia scopiformis TaxID=149040 RepID=A0A132B748_MOLSC|nr:uncharacterized protein LY89DRAFT_338423 [Mollisia scopiformis]KUJ08238.1 hypothetical protein LY89DRAFT_338423 [Mollisia scopiformis]